MRVIICGGGVIGACTAYFLSRSGIEVIVVERTDVAAAASGKAGGFLALDWCAGTPLDALAQRSFHLHAELAREISGDWAYRAMSAYTGYAYPGDNAHARAPSELAWLSDGVAITGQIGTPHSTAIVHPRKFTLGMMSAAEKLGAKLRRGRVTGIVRSADGSKVQGVELDGGTIEADAVVVAMGPWSLLASGWMPLPVVYGQRSPSVVYDTGDDIPADALFIEYLDERRDGTSVEVFPRGDGSTHVTAFSGPAPLPLDPADVAPNESEISRLTAICERLSPAFRPERIIARQACFRPLAQDGLPLIGNVAGSDGLYVATGHNVWGILNAPATGEALAELIAGERPRIDLSPFDPARLRPFDPAQLRLG
jgi:glycine/D-amino acid oxidase-like deaminating enzyme